MYRPITQINPADLNVEQRLVYLYDQVKKLKGATTATPVSPPIVAAPKITQGLTPTGGGVQFTFTQVKDSNISGYNIYRSSDIFPNAQRIDHINQSLSHPSITISDTIPSGAVYYYWVTAVDTTGTESAPAAAQATAVTSGSVVASNGGVLVGGTSAIDGNGNLILKNVGQSVGTTVTPTTASSTFATLPEISKTITTKGSSVLIVFNGIFSHSLTGGLVQIRLYKDGSNIGYECAMAAPAAGNSFPLPLTWLDSPTAGSHAYEIRWATTSGTATALATQRALQIVELG